MLKILAIGNSFSQDATAYLHQIAKSAGTDIKIVNLYIGGCSLQQHCLNIKGDLAEYAYELNGMGTGKIVTLREGLVSDKWDIVTMQQASYHSGVIDAYYPFITELSDYVKKYVPLARQMIHQTWAYETDSTHSAFPIYGCNQRKMYEMLKAAYKEVSEKLKLKLIPSGDLIQELRAVPEFDYANGKPSLCRDGFHLHLLYGRYAVNALWFEKLCGGNIYAAPFVPEQSVYGEMTPEQLEVIKATVHNLK